MGGVDSDGVSAGVEIKVIMFAKLDSMTPIMVWYVTEII